MADHPMKTFVTQDGKRFLLPGNMHREVTCPLDDSYWCECHEKMGNDFYFLPAGQCIRKDKTCNRVDA